MTKTNGKPLVLRIGVKAQPDPIYSKSKSTDFKQTRKTRSNRNEPTYEQLAAKFGVIRKC